MSWKLPITSEYVKEQMKHESTREYASDIYHIVKGYKYTNALEIGAAWGISALAILHAQPSGLLMSVDSSTRIRAPEEVKNAGLQDRYSYSIERSDEFWDRNKQTYDLIYIDGSHLYKDVKNDLYKAWDCLESRGLLLLDDYTHKYNVEQDYGVSLAVCEFLYDKKIKRILPTKHVLAIPK